MKLYKALLTCLVALGLVSCGCDLSFDNVQNISVEITEKNRVTDEKFDLDDIKATLDYGSYTRKATFKDFKNKNLTAACYFPDEKTHIVLTDDFTLTTAGTYTIEVNYAPKSRYQFDGCTGSATFEVEKKVIPATGIEISDTSLTICKGSTQSISCTLQPANATSEVTFSSNDVFVATVNGEGEITAVEEGQCIITAEANGFKKTCLVTVTPSLTVDYVFKDKNFKTDNGNWDYSEEGDSFDSRQSRGVAISADTEVSSPIEFADISNITFECSTVIGFGTPNKPFGVVEVYIGDEMVSSKEFNEYVTAYTGHYSAEGKSGKVKIVVKPNEVKFYLKSVSVTCNSSNIFPTAISVFTETSLGINETRKAYISYTPTIANRRIIEWSSSNEDILIVGPDGSITGISSGTAKVIAKAQTENGFTEDSIDVNVVKIDVESISLGESVIDIYESKTKTITYSVEPSNASYKDVTYTSSNPDIATVDATGNVTGISVGECTISIVSVDNPHISTTCSIKILEKPNLVSTTMSYNLTNYTENNYYTIDSSPSVGNVKLLVIPVWFTDSSTYIKSKDTVRSDIQKVYFGSEAETGWNSVKTFYETESNGKLSLSGTVSEWYECGYGYSKYNYDSGSSNETTTLVKNAVNWYFTNHTSDSRKNYDSDSDGFLDGVILIYGCPDYAAFESQASVFSRVSYGDNLWAYTYWVQTGRSQSISNPGVSSYFWASYDFMYSSGNYAKGRAGTAYGSGQTSRQTVDSHTFIHEMGHVFGLDDYYDYSNKYYPAGGFSMQDFNVGGHDPYSCLALGWAKAYIPVEDCEIKLKPFQSSHEVILLSPSFNEENSPFDEYLLIELYTPTGLNKFDTESQYNSTAGKGITSTGIRLWHVDARLVVLNTRGVASASTTYTHPVKNCRCMMSNTYYSTSASGYISPCGKSYADYNLLQLIRYDAGMTYKPGTKIRETDLFKSGSSFTMEKFKKQFVTSGKLNSGKTLGYSFYVSISGSNDNAVATISITKDQKN